MDELSSKADLIADGMERVVESIKLLDNILPEDLFIIFRTRVDSLISDYERLSGYLECVINHSELKLLVEEALKNCDNFIESRLQPELDVLIITLKSLTEVTRDA